MKSLRLLLIAVFMSYFLITVVWAKNKELSIKFSGVKGNEHLVFFRTTAWLNEKNQVWHIPIHGWVYKPQDSSSRKFIFAEVLHKKYGLQVKEETKENFSERVNLIIADNKRGRSITISLGGNMYPLTESSPNGHFKHTIEVPVEDIASMLKKGSKNNIIEYSALMKDGDKRIFLGQTLLLPPQGLSIISDIDDTIKISEVTNHKKLFDNTFFLDFAEVSSMAVQYKKWNNAGISIHFVSSSPLSLPNP